MYSKILFFSVLLAGLFGFSYANGQTYTVGVQDYENYLPYSQLKNNFYSGLGKDILDLFAMKKGYVFKYRAYPLKRVDRLFLEGKFDFRFPDNPYWIADDKKGIDITYAPVLDFTDGVLVLAKNKGKGINNLKKLGIPLGFTPYPYLNQVKAGRVNIYENSSYDGLYQQVLSGKIDGAYANIGVARYYWSKTNGVNEFPVIFDYDLPHTKGFHYISSIKHKEIVEEIDAFLKDASNKAAIDELKHAYRFDQEN